MTGWLPIETAPKDGTEVLVWGLETYFLLAGYQLVIFGRGKWRNDEGEEVEATHWMPLPPPPVDGDKGGA